MIVRSEHSIFESMKYSLFILVILLIGCKESARDKKINALIKLADKSDSLLHYQESINIYTDILRLDSVNIVALSNRGRAYVWAGEIKKGFADYDKVVQIRPGVPSYYRRGVAYMYINEARKALPDLRKVVELNPGFSEAYYWISTANSKMGNLDSARYYCSRADSIGFMREYSISVMYDIDMNARDYKKAVAIMTQAIRYFPDNYLWYNNRAYARNFLEEFAAAVEDCDSAIKLNPAFGYSYNNKGYALMGLNKLDSSLVYINRSLELAPNNPYAYKNRGVVLLLLNNREQACKDFVQSLKQSKDMLLTKEVVKLRDRHCY